MQGQCDGEQHAPGSKEHRACAVTALAIPRLHAMTESGMALPIVPRGIRAAVIAEIALSTLTLLDVALPERSRAAPHGYVFFHAQLRSFPSSAPACQSLRNFSAILSTIPCVCGAVKCT